VRLPRHSVWPILPGVRSFLNWYDRLVKVGKIMRGKYLCRNIDCAVWDVEIPNYENKPGGHDPEVCRPCIGMMLNDDERSSSVQDALEAR
jgi:hypothetical protein